MNVSGVSRSRKRAAIKWAEIAELPGCVTQGETLEELRANGLEAMEAALEVDTKDMQLTGVTPPDEDVRPYQQFNSWTG